MADLRLKSQQGLAWLVYWDLTPQQQPWSYQGGDYDDEDEVSVSGLDETRAPGENHRMASD